MTFQMILKYCLFLIIHVLFIKTETLYCPELFSTSLNIECFYEGNTTSCDDPMLNGTIAKLQCKYSYYLDSIPYTEMQCQNGLWNQPLFNCEPVCGMKSSKAIPFVIKGKIASRGDFPWHIGLYIKRKTYKKYICGGSILSPKLVITAAHCFSSNDPKSYQVAAGKVYRKWKHKNDDEAQYREVVNILIEIYYKGALTSYTADIAILVLNEVFILSDLIQPVCLDYILTNEYIIENNTAIVPGWGLISEEGVVSKYLQYANLPLRDHDSCLTTVPRDFQSQVTLDKICAGYTNGTSVCTGDSGGGLIVPRKINNETRYFLIGIVSTGPFNKDSCDSYQFTTFTLIKSHIEWINETKFKFENWSPYDYGCFLPDLPSFGSYIIDTEIPNRNELLPGSLVPHYTKLKYSCNKGYRIHGKQSITCKEKKWHVNNNLPACFRTCNKINSTELEIEYLFENRIGPSEDYILHETRALLRCKDINYELEEFSYNQTTCRDGKWTNPLPNCIAICGMNGVETDNDLNRISNSISGQYPWNVAVYKNVNNGLSLECAGTIISFFVVLTESNCINQNYQDRYIVVAGTNNKIINPFIIDKNTQYSTVFKKVVYYFFDIIILKTRFNITTFVRPVCLQSLQRIHKKKENITLEIPFWTEEDDDLKALKFESNIFSNDTSKTRLYLATNYTSGWLIELVKFKSSKRYCVSGFGKKDKNENNKIHFIFKEDIAFIQPILAISDIKDYEMNECIVPNTSKYMRTLEFNYSPGDTVPDGTKIKYTCEEYFSLYGSKEIICKNSTWIYPLGKPYCIGCGVSNLHINTNGSYNSSKIIYSVNPTMFPWTARIYNQTTNPPKAIHYGSIISSNVILTDNMYVNEYKDTEFTDNYMYYVEVGQYNWNTSLNKYNQRAYVEKILFSGIQDIVIVLILNKHLQINKHVLPVCLDFNGNKNVSSSSDIGVIPFGPLEKINDTTTKIKLLYINQPLKKIWDISYNYRHDILNCSNHDWNKDWGRALTFNTSINKNESRYFIFGLLKYHICKNKILIFLETYRYGKWIKSLVDHYA